MSRRGRVLVLAGLTAALATSCMPHAATQQEQSTYNLYQLFFWTAAVVAAIVFVLTTLAVIRFRRRPGQRDDQLPSQTRENTRLEIAWTALPFLTVFVLFIFTLATLNTVDAMPPNPALTVDVTAFRWSWSFAYPGKGVDIVGATHEVPEMVVPVGQNVHIVLTSADVAHAFWIPKFLFKRDAIPGIVNQFDFTVQQAGTYTGQCAEYCGLYHDQMIFVLRAVPPAQFQTWLAQQRAAASASATPSATGSPAVSGASPAPPASPVPSAAPSSGVPAPATSSPAASPSVSSPSALSVTAGSQP